MTMKPLNTMNFTKTNREKTFVQMNEDKMPEMQREMIYRSFILTKHNVTTNQ